MSSIFSKGKDKKDSVWFNLSIGKNVVIPLHSTNDAVMFLKHQDWSKHFHTVCLRNDNCPGCHYKVPRRKRYSLVFMTREDNTPRLLEYGKVIHDRLLELEKEEPSAFVGRHIVIEKTGNGLETQYAIGGLVKLTSNLPSEDSYPKVEEQFILDEERLWSFYEQRYEQ